MYRAVQQQDGTGVISARASAISSILIDSELVNAEALVSCTLALTQTVIEYPALACAGGVAQVAGALSSVLEKGSALPPALLSNVSAALVALSVGCQSISAIGEAAVTVQNANVRLLSAVADMGAAAELVFSAPQSALELLRGVAQSSVVLDRSGGGGSSRVTLVEYKASTRAASTNATTLGLRLDSTGSSNSSSYTIVLQNKAPVDYVRIEASAAEATCPLSSPTPYNVSVSCPEQLMFPAVNFTCPAHRKGTFSVTCPSRISRPSCGRFRGSQFSIDSRCTVVAFTATNTTCYCSTPDPSSASASDSSGGSRTLQDAQDLPQEVAGLWEYSALFQTFGTDVASTFVDAPSVSDLLRNPVIIAALSTLLGLTLFGFLGFYVFDRKERQHYLVEQGRGHIRDRSIASFFDALIPIALKKESWWARFAHRMMYQHNFLRLSVPYDIDGEWRSANWMKAMGAVLCFVFANCLVAVVLYADENVCDGVDTQSACGSVASLGGQKTCQWTEEQCEFMAPVLSITTGCILTLCVTILSLPMDNLWSYLVDNVTRLVRLHSKEEVPPKVPLLPENDEFHAVRTRQSTLMRGAFLDKALASDALSETAETAAILQNFDAYEQRWRDRTRYGAVYREHNMEQVVLEARRQTAAIVEQLEELPTDEEREAALMKHFMVDCFRDKKRAIVTEYLFGEAGEASSGWEARRVEMVGVMSFVGLMVFGGVMVYFILAFAVSIGPTSTALWMLLVVLSTAHGFILVQCSKIWMVFLLSSRSRVDQEVRVMCEGLAYKTPLVLRRVTGGLRNCDELVQHLNPACRAARLLPALPVSRLLMSLNDRDVPLPKRSELNRSVLLLFLFTLLACLPNALQDTTIDVSLGFATAFSVFGLALLQNLSLPAFAAVMIIAGLVIAFLCLGGYSLVRRCWVKEETKVIDARHYSVVSSLDAALERMRQDNRDKKEAESEKQTEKWHGSFSLKSQDVQLNDVGDVGDIGDVEEQKGQEENMGDVGDVGDIGEVEDVEEQ
ncbi:hypothetical protein B484DRAFT_437024, partial [Ochromonadaceae sp. CCMP2298]